MISCFILIPLCCFWYIHWRMFLIWLIIALRNVYKCQNVYFKLKWDVSTSQHCGYPPATNYYKSLSSLSSSTSASTSTSTSTSKSTSLSSGLWLSPRHRLWQVRRKVCNQCYNCKWHLISSCIFVFPHSNFTANNWILQSSFESRSRLWIISRVNWLSLVSTQKPIHGLSYLTIAGIFSFISIIQRNHGFGKYCLLFHKQRPTQYFFPFSSKICFFLYVNISQKYLGLYFLYFCIYF